MNTLNDCINNYLFFCQYQKCLDSKTLKAYRIDLTQFANMVLEADIANITITSLEHYITSLHQKYKAKTVKRKIASVKAFYHYLEYKDIITANPFNKLHIKFRESIILPKTIPLHTVEHFLKTIYQQYAEAPTPYHAKRALRDIAIIELLFATGIRISELSTLKVGDVNLIENNILVHGKGRKERRIQIGNDDVVKILRQYKANFHKKCSSSDFFFITTEKKPISDQAVRRMIKKYTVLAGIDLHITPHMFRHTFATSLLESDVDIRYIQKLLGHSSINITEIYTHVTAAKQGEILRNKHPRKDFKVNM